MSNILKLESYGYYISLQLVGFVCSDDDDYWYALLTFDNQLFEKRLDFSLHNNNPENRINRKVGVDIVIKDTPYGDISYSDFKPLTNITASQFLPKQLIQDLLEAMGSNTI